MEIVYFIAGVVVFGVAAVFLEKFGKELIQFCALILGLYLAFHIYVAVGRGCVSVVTG